MNVASPVHCPSELALDRLVVGELGQGSDVAAHVSSCHTCAERVADRERCVAAFAGEVPLAKLVGDADRKVRAARRRKVWAAAAAGMFAVVCATVVWRTIDGDSATRAAAQDQGEDIIRRKGGLAMKVMAKRQDGSVSYVVSPATLAPGDAIQFAVTTDRPGYLAIVGVDAAGVVSPYVPDSSDTPLRLPAGADQLMDGSIILDDTRGFERIFAVLCHHRFEMQTLLGRARTALATAKGDPSRVELADEPGCLQTSFLVEKSSGGG